MNTRITFIFCAAALGFILILGVSPVHAQTYAPSSPPTSYPTGERPPEVLPDVMEVLREQDRYSVLVAALERTAIDQGLRISPSFTLLAPTDSAFAALDVRLSELTSYEVAEIVRNHVIQKALTTAQLQNFSRVENTRGFSIELGTNAEKVGGATLVQPDLAIENGIVHGIDTVFTMKTQVSSGHAVQ